MKSLLSISIFIISMTTFAQQSTVKGAFLEKWENSKNYLIAVAEAMPEKDYDFKPSERQMTFKEQLVHIEENIYWLEFTYLFEVIMEERTKPDPNALSKKEVIEMLDNGFDSVSEMVREMTDEELTETVNFIAGKKSKLQLLNLLHDHVTHHRGQLIVYLNLKNIEPPKYVGW